MEWSDDAIVLAVRAHGETAAILEALTREHGRHAGLVHGGASRKAKAMLQPGNSLRVTWRARLEENLGSFHIEAAKMRAGVMLEHREALAGLNAFTSVASAVLPEREPHRPVFEAGEILLDAIADDGFEHWGPLYVRWEAGLLEELGFGLDLSQCAATGATEDLAFLSPRTGRAISRAAAGPYKERLLPLPQFLLGSQNATASWHEIAAGLRLTAYFLLDRVLAPHNKTLPAARLRLEELVQRESK
ncbi:MAG TPA: DNA repair protein RecO [Rhizomicrobium sp.]|nr:DNA repair protein RecO [Rhizomicrobium sp.]